jgi:prephenate dehydrogenase
MQNTNTPFQRVAVIGLGLIGGSLCLALRRVFPNVVLTGVDNQHVIEQARHKVDHVFLPNDLEKSLRGISLVFLATPINAIIEYLPRVAASVDHATLVTDVGSTKALIVDAARRAMAGRGYFIGGHPMAGKEHTGWQHANASLFENAAYVVTPGDPVPEKIRNDFFALLRGIGSRVSEMSAEKHDRLVAEVSHLPQLLAVALMNYVGREDSEREMRLQLAAGGFRDMTRIAESPFHVWQDILLTNRAAIKKSLSEFREHMALLEVLVDDIALDKNFQRANDTRRQIEA